ncbi:hypothetical protein GJ698_06530 [Pseudoduganella sp. FT26W]|uniref:YozE SAM-like domain-containing protein n=1 Tax=Duganella aquatilis TaxID=2666082 RepID=A0A844D908_9BURK|nr:YozE family protein [Duganella aquatilis]MRW83749.1 hypothetical protein [Duganella aquatilis]
MKIEIEIPDTDELDGISDEDMERIIDEAIRTTHWHEYAGVDIDLTDARARVVESAWSKKPPRSFLTWLKTQTKREDIVGDFARDAAKDPRAPGGRATKGEWRDYLGGAQHLVEALNNSWNDFLIEPA